MVSFKKKEFIITRSKSITFTNFAQAVFMVNNKNNNTQVRKFILKETTYWEFF